MKKIHLLSLFLFAVCTLSFGKEVPVSTAKTIGYHYLLQHGGLPANTGNDLELVYTSQGTSKFFYIFSGKHNFVIVSADDAVTPVLGYACDRPFDGGHIPNTVKSFLENYNDQISYAIANRLEATTEVRIRWDNLLRNIQTSANKTTSVAPLLATTWNQAPYYNDNCPYDASAGGRSVTGCVATATAQVMKYWSWPNQGMGFHSYSTPYGTLSANFAGTTYNWGAMPNNVTGANAAVATLMYHVGVSVDMNYSASSSGSGAYVISSASPVTNCAEYALKTYFDYKTTTHGVQRTAYSNTAWLTLIKGELDAARPVIYAGFGTAGGHCFVADGYDASDNFHINWGWGGSSDGYYYMDALNPPSLGAGGGGGGFNSDQQAIIGLEPNNVSTTLELYDYITLSKNSMQYADTFSLNTNFYNSGTTNFNGSICLAAFDATTGAFVTYIDSFSGVNLPAGYVYAAPGVDLSGLFSVAMIPGTYNIKILYRSAGGGSWSTVATGGSGAYINSATLQVYNHNFIELYTNMTATPSPLVQGSSASVSFKLYNNDVSYNYNDSLYLGLYNMDGSPNSTIGYLGATAINASAASGTLTFNTASITAAPGSYVLVAWFKYSGNWYVCGADYAQNPINVNVIAAPPPPDMYEVNNTAATAYDLSSTLSWSSNIASTGTPGSTIHVASDHDYYKVVLPSGYNYAISARANDAVNKDDAATYTNDVVWSYSTNGGASWSAAYNNTMSGTIDLTGLTGGTVIFHVSSANAGGTGSYLLKLKTITRSVPGSVPDPALSSVRIFPNPATDVLTVDMNGTNITATEISLTNMAGKVVYTADAGGSSRFTVPVGTLPAGLYFVAITTDAGTVTRKITITK